MSFRLAKGGRLIDRSKPVAFTFNGRSFMGHAGDTLASALLANNQLLVGRSFKYHRPRGIVASGAEEPNALVGLGEGDRFEPNQRATTTELFEGLRAQSQNHWPSLEFDVGAINARLSRFFPAGFYYKTFFWPRAAWKHLFEPIVRQSAGLGKAPHPETRDPDRYEQMYHHNDVVIIGGGVAGLTAALTAGRAGHQVLLLEQTAHWGGRSRVDGGEIEAKPAAEWITETVDALSTMDNVTLVSRCMGAGLYDHGYLLAYERLTDHDPSLGGPRHRLWRIRAEHLITATGAIERPLSFAGNDIPGVMLASAVRDYLSDYAVAPGKRIVVVTNNDDAYRTALETVKAGLCVPAIIDTREAPEHGLVAEARQAGISVLMGKAIAQVHGSRSVTGVSVCAQSGAGAAVQDISCDAIAMSGGWSPVVHLWSHCGGKLLWDETGAMFRPDPARPPKGADGQSFVTAIGAANGALHLCQTVADACDSTSSALNISEKTSGPRPSVCAPEEAPLMPVWLMPQSADYGLRSKAWLDFQNDVKVSDIQLAAQEGYESVEHTKRYTTIGMATDQGKLSNINGLAVLSDALGQPIPQTGTTTFRPPYTPISMGAIAGEARGDLFQPVRRTPMQDWHEERGAYLEPVGQWQRPYCYPIGGETHHDAVMREVINTRENLGLLDASTLGKIIVKGRDAGRFLDMLYTNMMSTLKPGRCRYGLMCSENGFLMDDGVVVRLDEDSFLCHTTSGGAAHVHAHMEEWLQTEWWDWQVYTADVTEQWAQVAVVGPQARALLEALGSDTDLSAGALPFMAWTPARIGGFDTRVFRISFSGELSFEIAVPASQGRAFWDALHREGAAFGAMPYGTEALHIMRAEKGFIMIGDETDGTVIPQDLGLHWAISKKKDDYLGKRAQQRSHMTDPERWQLVGLETLDGSTLPDGAYAVGQGVNANGQATVIGRVTSTYHSPTLGRGIAMGLVQRGPERMGQTISFAHTDGSRIATRLVSPVFFDPEGEKQNV